MEFLEVIRKRKTTNGPFLDKPVSREHQHLLMEAASRAPSHFNSQPWRFVLIEDKAKREQIAELGGSSMERLIAEGKFFERYRPYFRFSEQEMQERRDGILIDQLPGPLRPFTRQITSPGALGLLRALGVPKVLGEDNRKLIAGSPLLLAALLVDTPTAEARGILGLTTAPGTGVLRGDARHCNRLLKRDFPCAPR